MSEEVMLTPALAHKLLSNNVINRPLKPPRVAYFARLINNGEFLCTHQGLAVDWDGQLQDGQHRCHAVIRTGKSVPVRITYDADPANFPAIDGAGAARSTADYLHVAKPVAEVVRLAAKISYGGHVITPGVLKRFHDAIGRTAADLLVGCTAKSKLFSTAPMKLAAVTSILQGNNAEYVKSVYRNLVLAKVDQLPPIGKGMVSQHLRGAHVNTNTGDLLARGMTVFNIKAKNTTRVQVKDYSVTVDKVRAFYRDLVPLGRLGH